MQNATLYINDVAVGCCDIELPATLTTEWEVAPWSPSASTSFKLRNGRKMRRLFQRLDDLLIEAAARPSVRHYRRVKKHQARKRLARKRLHA